MKNLFAAILIMAMTISADAQVLARFISKDTTMGVSQTKAPNEYAARKAITAARPYKVYTALLTQTDTLAPVATVLENTLGVVPSISYEDIGVYFISATGLFPQNKTIVFISGIGDASNASIRYEIERINNNTVRVTSANNGDLIDGYITLLGIEIRVYN